MADTNNKRFHRFVDQERELVGNELDYIVATKKLDAKHPVSKTSENIRSGTTTKPDDNAYTTGICFSGGGIRSAMFSLGVMHCLSKAKLLGHMDYLSTVSGGGYIGGALTWWLNPASGAPEDDPYTLEDNFPFGEIPPDQPNPKPTKPLDYLLAKGSFLTPGNGIGVMSGLSIVLRAIFLNLLVWIPLAGLLMYVFLALGHLHIMRGMEDLMNMIAPGFLGAISGISASSDSGALANILPPVFIVFVIAVVLFLVFFLASSVIFSILSWLDHSFSKPGKNKVAHVRGYEVEMGTATFIALRWVAAFFSTIITTGLAFYIVSLATAILPEALTSEVDPASVLGRLASLTSGIIIVVLLFLAYLAVKYFSPDDVNKQSIRNNIARFTIVLLIAMAIDQMLKIRAGFEPWAAADFAHLSAILQIACAVLVVLLMFMLNGILVRVLVVTNKISLRYGERRLFEQLFGKLFTISIVLLVFVSIPVVINIAEVSFGGGINGRITLAAGVISALVGYYRTNVAGLGGWATDLFLIIGSVFLIYGVLATGYDLANAFDQGDGMMRGALIALLALAIGTGFLTNLNYISLNRLYRDRIAEAFMPDYKTIADEDKPNRPASGADALRLCDSWNGRDAVPTGPYHLINTNVILVNEKDAKYKLRGGDNYILAPLYSGSQATGWIKTDHLANGEITIPSAVAASGAAANPNSGMSGRGPTRKFFVSLAMNLLSIRLSYWVPNPSPDANARVEWLNMSPRAHHFYPHATYALTPLGYQKNSGWLELSDGGHFENNGLYEMIRRRAGLIIVCDGGQDLNTNFETLGNALDRATEDFGATFDFDLKLSSREDPSKPEDTIPQDNPKTYPPDAKYAKRGYFMARITYDTDDAWTKEGVLIYLKSSMLESLSPATKAYKGRFPDFPNQTTADQFFGTDQSNAYRDAGYKAALQMLDETGLAQVLKPGKPRPALKTLLSNAKWKPT